MARNKTDVGAKFNAPFPTRLRTLMDKMGETQESVAKAAGKTRQTISQYVNGISEPSYDTLVKIATHFSVSTDYLLGLTDVKAPDTDLQAIVQKTGLSENNITLLRIFTKPFDVQCDSNHNACATEIISDYAIYDPNAKYAIALVNDFIEFAFGPDTIPDIPFEHYCSFRQQIERSNKYAQEWNELTDNEQYQHALAACDANNSALAGGLFPFAPEDAAILFLKIFCDSFYNYLNSKYPASKHPLNFGWTSRGD